MENADIQSRSTLRAWVLYMVSHPAYFYQATGWRMTDANVEMIATELFRNDARLGYRILRIPVRIMVTCPAACIESIKEQTKIRRVK